ncbi:hypothetical protein ABT301_35690, partial [Streptomyces sp. NPDC000987]|uniref:hypothetical protein n=1 Tax=Streptomyces sp. NPDC000987 TaxID=3154374 RepID=UPI00332FB436
MSTPVAKGFAAADEDVAAEGTILGVVHAAGSDDAGIGGADGPGEGPAHVPTARSVIRPPRPQTQQSWIVDAYSLVFASL